MKDKDIFFENIVEENKDKIYRICCYYVSDEDDIKDLYQETLVNIWKGLDKFRGDAAVSTWIFRVTANTALGFLAKKKVKISDTTKLDSIEIKTVSENNNKLEEIKILHKCISQLPLIDMIIISLVLEEVQSKEIAKITGLTDSNVRIRTHRIKSTLKKLIKGEK